MLAASTGSAGGCRQRALGALGDAGREHWEHWGMQRAPGGGAAAVQGTGAAFPADPGAVGQVGATCPLQQPKRNASLGRRPIPCPV